MFKFGMAYPYQRYGMGKQHNPYQRIAEIGLFNTMHWYGMPIPKTHTIWQYLWFRTTTSLYI